MTTKTIQETFNQLFSTLAMEKTFSGEALKVFNTLKVENEELLNKYNSAMAGNKAYAAEVEKILGEQRALMADSERLLKIIKDMEAEVAAARTADKARAVAQAESAAYRFALETVFKPVTVREHVSKNIPILTPGSTYPITHPETADKYTTSE